MKRVWVFLSYWILGTLDTEGQPRRFSLSEACQIATLMARLPKLHLAANERLISGKSTGCFGSVTATSRTGQYQTFLIE